ncbi:NADPH-dependent FMN reductase [Paraburkholderia fungorum]|uniref:NADPH-dependent FMN reductase n=2 Tax=Paraburkholderia fungorum TaxID=134537 RepID=A0A1H1JPU6_9BURK|nr:flavodoxin family protein [Paraburkholderia fungorum]SDR51497.1 NADPH-dependent FMN reductase [Paraburkholderia fungorum]
MNTDSRQPDNYQTIEVRKGQVTEKMSREAFRERFMGRFYDPAFRVEDASLSRLESIAWDAYCESRKSPVTDKAGLGFADPDYDLSVEWRTASERIKAAQKKQQDKSTRSRVLIVNASSRNDFTCPGEMSKSFRLGKLAQQRLESHGIEVDFLDLSRLNSEHDLHIHPCKGCVSTAMPLCHWPCSCYPNHSLGLVNDWMNEIYERFAACHGVLFVTPVYWYQVTGPLKQLIDRLVCADGGNPDPTSTHGKKADEAKRIELAGWDYPKHLAGRAYGLVVHGDVAGIEGSRRALTDWLNWMGFIEAGAKSRLDRFIGYYEPYATSHATLDRDKDMQDEVANVAEALANTVGRIRQGFEEPDNSLAPVRAK